MRTQSFYHSLWSISHLTVRWSDSAFGPGGEGCQQGCQIRRWQGVTKAHPVPGWASALPLIIWQSGWQSGVVTPSHYQQGTCQESSPPLCQPPRASGVGSWKGTSTTPPPHHPFPKLPSNKRLVVASDPCLAVGPLDDDRIPTGLATWPTGLPTFGTRFTPGI